MDLTEKIRTIPLRPGVYLYKNAEGEVIYVGKAKNLRARVRSYFQEGVGKANAKTGSLLREAVDVEYIVVDNNKATLALAKDLTTPETYQEAVRDVQLLLEGRQTDLSRSLRARMQQAAEQQEYERAAKC